MDSDEELPAAPFCAATIWHILHCNNYLDSWSSDGEIRMDFTLNIVDEHL